MIYERRYKYTPKMPRCTKLHLDLCIFAVPSGFLPHLVVGVAADARLRLHDAVGRATRAPSTERRVGRRCRQAIVQYDHVTQPLSSEESQDATAGEDDFICRKLGHHRSRPASGLRRERTGVCEGRLARRVWRCGRLFIWSDRPVTRPAPRVPTGAPSRVSRQPRDVGDEPSTPASPPATARVRLRDRGQGRDRLPTAHRSSSQHAALSAVYEEFVDLAEPPANGKPPTD